MKLRKSYLLGLAVLLLAGVLLFTFLRLNRYQTEGEMKLPGLSGKVTVVRDEKGMPYIHASTTDDLMTALGFVTAQDRLFQMELTRRYVEGRLSEFAGAETADSDIRMRTIGFHRNAKKVAPRLDPETRRSIQKYLDGVNAYISGYGKEHPIEFRLAGIRPEPWEISDSLAILYFMSWNSSGNLDTEIVAQALVEKLGVEKARALFPLNINPDDPASGTGPAGGHPRQTSSAVSGFASDRKLLGLIEDRPLRVGSNNWAVGSRRSPGGKPIVSNDAHLDARMLPGPWYPVGLICPAFRWVGAAIPGIPGSNIGRNDHVALGVTNAYGDIQDLYIETIDPADPGRYLEGTRSIPFEIIPEKISIRDKSVPAGQIKKKFEIRLTRRGPVVSEVLAGLASSKVVSMRWAPFELPPPRGLDSLMKAGSAREVREILSRLDFFALNFVFADREGNIGWAASGKLPIRARGDGTIPFEVRDGKDNWVGWIPFNRMPQAYNPGRDWVGTCNHFTVAKDFPYYYSTLASPSYRYRRLIELMKEPAQITPDDHWRFQRDDLNLMAKSLAPVMASALKENRDTAAMAGILADWNFEDRADLAAPTVFQAVYSEFARLIFEDKLGKETAALMLKSWYFWQERLQNELLHGSLQRPETAALFRQAAWNAYARWSPVLGNDPAKWLWGKAHTIEFVNPIRRKGFGKELLGAVYPMAGSGETLYRAVYDFRSPFGVIYSASLRMVADLGDPDKVIAVLPGGVCGRTFHPHAKDQLDSFMNGEKRYWWFSDRAIREHAQSSLLLAP